MTPSPIQQSASSFQMASFDSSESLKSMVHWLGRLVSKIPKPLSTSPSLVSVWCIASDLLYDELATTQCQTAEHQKQTWSHLTELAQRRTTVSVDHRVRHNFHSIHSCSSECPEAPEEFIFFREHNQAPLKTALGAQATLYIGFDSQHWHTLVDLLIACCGLDQFKEVVSSAKITSRTFTFPAILYLYNSESPAELISFLTDKMEGLSESCSVPGSHSLTPWLHYTEQRLDANGCQPESRADILTRAYEYHIKQCHSPGEAIIHAADDLGYEPERPAFLKKPTASFQSLQQITLETKSAWEPSIQQVREIRSSIRSSLANYGFLQAFTLNETQSGPWHFVIGKDSDDHASVTSERVSLSIQLKPESMETGLEQLLDIMTDTSEFHAARFTLRDPCDPLFKHEPFMIEFRAYDHTISAVKEKLKSHLSNDYLAPTPLPCHEELRPGILLYKKETSSQPFPSSYEQLHHEVVVPIQILMSTEKLKADRKIIQSQLFRTGRSCHDPLQKLKPIVRPARR